MSLPAPDLDDRRFQELVDDAKRMVQQRCPEWTDHNVSDPGVTLIELFAWMTDQVVYRLNRVPDRNFVKFLELLGVRLYPPAAARVSETFWLSAPQDDPVTVPAGVQVATERSQVDEEVVFTTVEPVEIVPTSLERLRTAGGEDAATVDHTDLLQGGDAFHCFGEPPEPDDAFLLGLADPAPACAVALRLDAEIEGVGVDPDDPPLVWEAWDGDGWAVCDVERDETGGLNRAGDVVVHLPREHTASLIDDRRAGWLRCRVVAPHPDQPFYSASPRILGAEAFTVGGSATAVHAELVDEELLGLSEGVAGQRFSLDHRPLVPAEDPPVLEVSVGEGWQSWTAVPDFSESGPDDRHFVLDEAAGEVLLGPAVRREDGTLVHYGAVPPQGAALRLTGYRTGGGQAGNVAAGTLTAMKSTVPLIASVSNRRAAAGGVDAETIEEAKVRGPLLVRTRNRAVTPEDYEVLAREAAPEVARVRCVPVGGGDDGSRGARVLVVPHAGTPGEGLSFEQLVPADETLERIAAFLDERRPDGARVVVEPPVYQGVTIVARLRAARRRAADRLEQEALEALNRYFSPLTGGPAGEGWPFGRALHVGEVYAVLQGLEGTGFVEDAQLFAADPITGERGEAAERLDIDDNALVFSYEHQLRVEEG